MVQVQDGLPQVWKQHTLLKEDHGWWESCGSGQGHTLLIEMLSQQNIYGHHNVSMHEDEDFMNGLLLHLQEIGKYVSAMDIVHYLDKTKVKTWFNLKKTVSLATAQWWVYVKEYQWTKTPHGQFIDGHGWDDIVNYRQKVFLPHWAELETLMWCWKMDGEELTEEEPTVLHATNLKPTNLLHHCLELWWIHILYKWSLQDLLGS